MLTFPLLFVKPVVQKFTLDVHFLSSDELLAVSFFSELKIMAVKHMKILCF